MNILRTLRKAAVATAAISLLLAPTLGASPARAATVTVIVGQNAAGANNVNLYNPSTANLVAGDTLTWNSAPDARSHDVTSYDGTWFSPTLRSGTAAITYSRVFSAAGTYTYYCSLHANASDAAPAVINASIAAGLMVGKIVVAAPVADTTVPVTSLVSALPNPTEGAASVTLTATVADTGTPTTAIAAAEYTVGATAGAAGTGTAMAASDGSFSTSSEGVTAAVPVGTYAAGTSITLWVRGKDSANNWSLAVSTTVSITATPAGSVPVTVVVTSGTLTNSTYNINFGPIGMTGADLILTAPNGAWRAIDARGTGAGWNVSVTTTDFSSTLGAIAAANFKVSLPSASITKIAGNALPTSGATTYQPLGTTPLKMLAAGIGQGMGTYDYLCNWQLTVPAQTLAGSYTAVMVVSINSGP